MGTLYAQARHIAPEPTGLAGGNVALRVTFLVATLLALSSAAVLFIGTKEE